MNDRKRKTEMPDEVVKLGQRIQEIIDSKGLKTREVAHDAEMDVENLRKYIKGKQEMKVTTLLRVSSALGVSVGDLFPS